MTPDTAWRDALALTRPRQWPILSAQLAVGMFLAVPDPADLAAFPAAADLAAAAAAWVAWVVLLNGGTLAYNSAWDRDTGPVAYLRHPPMPPRWLGPAALAAMSGGAVLGAIGVGPSFGAVIAVCVLLSVLYSHPRTRWKARPGLDLLVNMVGYGAGTTLAGLLAGARVVGGPLPSGGAALAVGFGLLFGSFYPMTQIYQRADDLERGDRTLVTALGVRPALGLAAVLGLGAAALLVPWAAGPPAILVAAALAAWLGHALWWLIRAPGCDDADHERGMYRALVLWACVDAALVAAHGLAA